jgi:hypothetical protein
MGARDLLEGLASVGVKVTADGDRLVVRPASKLTDSLRAELLAAKPEVLALLTAHAADSACTRARLLRWGWSAAEADATTARLARRRLERDDRVSCAAECAHYRPGRCGNHRAAGLASPEVGRELAGLLQRCPGFKKGG